MMQDTKVRDRKDFTSGRWFDVALANCDPTKDDTWNCDSSRSTRSRFDADISVHPQDEMAELYHQRWLVELDIRAIKCSLGMDVLRCKTPEMVRREIWTCLLAYNLIRKTMLQSAMESGLSPRRLSFTNAMQTMAASWVVLPALDHSRITLMISAQRASLACPIVGNRPDRIEPRAVKRRPKPMRLLNMPREAAREQLRCGVDPYQRRR